MADHILEEDLLQSIEEVEARIQNFRKKVRAVLADLKDEDGQIPSGNQAHVKT